LAKIPHRFSAEYQALVSPRYALKDILHLEQVLAFNKQRISLLNPGAQVDHYRLHFYSRQPRYLDEYIPVLENMHLRVMDQVQFSVTVDGITLFIKSFTIKAAKKPERFIHSVKKPDAGNHSSDDGWVVENDALNKLCVLTGLAWQEIDVLRAYRIITCNWVTKLPEPAFIMHCLTIRRLH